VTKFAVLYQRAVVDISIAPGEIPPTTARRVKRHLLADPQSTEALCGYSVGKPGDIVGAYVDPGSEACQRCGAEADKAAKAS
jgi:hypothetical protein